MRLCDALRSQAAIASRPGMMVALEGIADEVEWMECELDRYRRLEQDAQLPPEIEPELDDGMWFITLDDEDDDDG